MKNNKIEINVDHLKIDPNYFDNYGGEGSYSENYKKYTYTADQIILGFEKLGVSFESILDVGCATGELVRDFRNFGIRAYGIDNNKYSINNNIVKQYCVHMDILDLSSIKDKTFDCLYCNCLMYLWPEQCLNVLNEFNRICKYGVYLSTPYKGEAFLVRDPYRKFLATRDWWREQFKKAGFKQFSRNIYLKA